MTQNSNKLSSGSGPDARPPNVLSGAPLKKKINWKKGGGKNITFLQQFCVGASEPLAINTQICCWPSGVRGPGQASQAESQGQIGSIQHSLAEGSHQSGSNRAKYRERQRAKYPELLQTGAR